MRNKDEEYVLNVATKVMKLKARYATLEEDCGHQKADVVINHKGKEYFFQVSHTPKSKKQQEKLLKRGAIPIATHKFIGMKYSNHELADMIHAHLE